MIRHDPNCPACAGRGHVFVDPSTRGFTHIGERGGAKLWRGPSGGVHVFAVDGKLMVLCDCIEEVTP